MRFDTSLSSQLLFSNRDVVVGFAFLKDPAAVVFLLMSEVGVVVNLIPTVVVDVVAVLIRTSWEVAVLTLSGLLSDAAANILGIPSVLDTGFGRQTRFGVVGETKLLLSGF